MRFKLYLSNWVTDHFEIRSVARSKVAIMNPGLNSIFFFQKCGMCWVFAQQVTYVPSLVRGIPHLSQVRLSMLFLPTGQGDVLALSAE